MLAQDWLYGERIASSHDAQVTRFLQLPDKFDKHSNLAVLNSLAERIVFTDDIPSILYDMNDNKQLTFEGVLSSARLPYDCFWMEYYTLIGMGDAIADGLENSAYGALVQRIAGDAVRMYIIIGLRWRGYPMISTLAYVVDFDTWPPLAQHPQHHGGAKALTFSIIYAFNYKRLLREGREPSKSSIADLGAVVNELIFGIFLVTQPRVYNDEQVTWKQSHKLSRAKGNKPPLLEYRKIRLRIGKTRKRYGAASEQATASGATTRGRSMLNSADASDTESEASVQHRRYHKVMGHFRHYINHDPPHTTWIEPHYRGDPALGVTFTERDVTR